MRKRKRRKRKTVYRNSDAERFIALAKFRKRQADELREMDESFNREPDELEVRFEYAINK